MRGFHWNKSVKALAKVDVVLAVGLSGEARISWLKTEEILSSSCLETDEAFRSAVVAEIGTAAKINAVINKIVFSLPENEMLVCAIFSAQDSDKIDDGRRFLTVTLPPFFRKQIMTTVPC